jgi:membrane protein
VSENKIIQQSEELERKYQETLYVFGKRLLKSFFVFKKNKGEFAAATVTFYILMSFTPLLLVLISAYGYLVGDQQMASQQMFATLEKNFPHLAPWILKSIQSIIKTQIIENGQFSMVGIGILIYGSLGFTTSLNHGLSQMAKAELKGGKIIEDIRAMFSAVLCGLFGVLFVYITAGVNVDSIAGHSMLKSIYLWGLKKDLWQAIAAMGFLVLYFKSLTPIKIRLSDAFKGAVSFTLLFFIGKSFFWVYLKVLQKDVIANFGNFYTLVEAVLWIYFIACSFFYSATVAYEHVHMRNAKKSSEPPAIDSTKIAS